MRVQEVIEEIERMNSEDSTKELQMLLSWLKERRSKRTKYWRDYKRDNKEWIKFRNATK